MTSLPGPAVTRPADALRSSPPPGAPRPAACRRRGPGLAGVAGAVPGAPRPHGHTVYNLDFANPVPADDPAPLWTPCGSTSAAGHRPPRAAAALDAAPRGGPAAARPDSIRCAGPCSIASCAGPRRRAGARGRAGRRRPGLADRCAGCSGDRPRLRRRGDRATRRRVLAAPRRDQLYAPGRAPAEQVEAIASWCGGGQLRATPPAAAAQGQWLGRLIGSADAGPLGRADR